MAVRRGLNGPRLWWFVQVTRTMLFGMIFGHGSGWEASDLVQSDCDEIGASGWVLILNHCKNLVKSGLQLLWAWDWYD